MYEIRLLGPLQFLENGTPIRGFRSVKAQALWAYLCLIEIPVPRTTLVNFFWPDMDEARGRRNLSWVLSQLNKKLPGSLKADRHQVQYVHHPDFAVDAHQFQALVNQNTLETLQQAVALHQDDLMQGIFLDECPEFESWLTGEREMWRQQVVQAMTQLMSRQAKQGHYRDGIETAQRLLRLDPWNETVYQTLMRLFYFDGQKEAAITQFKRCEAVLLEELGISPTLETQKLFEDILAGTLPVPQTSPPPQSAKTPSNIPASLGVSIGRHHEIASIIDQLTRPDCRLLTITGLGGVGKTHVALQTVRQMVLSSGELFPSGMFYVNLSHATNMNQMILEIGRVLQLPFSDTIIDLQAQLLMALQGKKRLLLLDNMEQLIDESQLIVEMLKSCPDLKLLVTSRIPLRLPDEWVVQLDGLQTGQRIEGVDRSASARQLFLHRARQQRDYQPSADDLAAIDDICRLVDGLPLGIELAAALIRLISPIDLYESLANNLDNFLTESLNQDLRSRSLNAVVAYSWSQLSEPEREALRALSIFEGGFTREVATVVAGTSLQTLAILKDYALIRLSPIPGRFTLHSIVRVFVRQQESTGRASLSVYAQAHAFYFGDWLHRRTPELKGPRQRHVLQLIERDWGNIRLAWQWAAEHSSYSVPFFAKAYEAVFHFCDMRSRFREGLILFLAAIQSIDPQESDPFAHIVMNQLRARAGWFSFLLGAQVEGRDQLQQSLQELEETDRQAETLFARNYLAAVLRYMGQLDEALALAQRSLTWLYDPVNRPDQTSDNGHIDSHVLGITHNILSQISFDQGDYAAAEEHGRLSLRFVREIQNHWSMGFSLVNLGEVALAQEDFDRARQWFSESLAIRRETGDQRGIALCLTLLGECSEGEGDLDAARELYEESHNLFDEIDNQWGLALTLKHLGRIAHKQNDLFQSRRYFWRSLRKAMRMQAQGLLWETLQDLQSYPFSAEQSDLQEDIRRLLEAEKERPDRQEPQRTQSTQLDEMTLLTLANPDTALLQIVERILRLFEI